MERYERNCRLAYAEKIGMEKGMEKGIKQGNVQKQQEIARNLLNNNVPVDIIVSSTGLSLEELNALK